MQPAQTADDKSLGRLVAKNTFYLTASQALTIPIAMLVNVAVARFLSADDVGIRFWASTMAGFGFLVVNWGHESALPALIARERARAGALLGSSLAWRVLLSGVVYAALALGCYAFNYRGEAQWALALTFVITGFASLIGACKDTIRGFERTDIPAVVHVVQQFLTALLIVPALYLGGSLNVSLAVQIPISMLVLVMIWRWLRPVGVGGLSVSKVDIDALTHMGTPFVFLGLATALQPTIDAIFLSKLAPHEVMGWYAVARQLIGVLLLPATALTGALYPTLCRLHIEDREAFVRVGRGSLSSVALAAVPIAMGCYLFPDIGIALFGRKKYAPSEHNLQMLAPFLFLLYFSIPLGTCIVAANKRKSASFVQALCVVVSVVLDPLLIPLFERRSGNGGLGVCIASIVSEAVVVVGFIALVPRGIFDRALVRVLALSMACGGLMALVPYLLRPYLSPFILAPLSVCVYAGALVLTGAIDKQQMQQLKSGITRKLLRR